MSGEVLGIMKAVSAGMKVKINSVIMKNINEDEVIALFEFAKKHGVEIRYIEFMENSFANQGIKGFTSDEILTILASKYAFTQDVAQLNSPATLYKTADGYTFGTIEPHRDDFCASCNRLRLSAEGDLIPCLYFDEALSVKEALREQDTLKAEAILKTVVQNKPEKNRWNAIESETSSRAFYHTGG